MLKFSDFLNEEQDGDKTFPDGKTPQKIIKYKDGRRTVKRTCLEPGYRYNPDTRRCERIPMSTQRKMKIGAKRRNRLMKSRMNSIVRKRKKSLKIRQARMGS